MIMRTSADQAKRQSLAVADRVPEMAF